MGRKKLVVVFCFLFIGCISFYHHPKGGFRPKKPEFSLAKEPFVFNNQIDTMAVYIKTDTLKYGEYKSVSFLKFYNNGRFFISSKRINEQLTKSNLIPGSIGYYALGKKVVIESYFIDPLDKRKIEYIKENGFIEGDTIFIESRFIKNKKYKYVKQKLDFIPEPSNW